ncbi:MAG: 2-amino-4-hydroxy-6-hydroxymethyldihydropteridine diphosphokinase [Acidobacteriaceae bacterium]|nr:2-amino-4-hydroxy-6-hydroxymethyldihydropteridine diphosphokinase [Acidobacteriaceae bacterium]
MAHKTVYLALGSNLGDRRFNLRRACEALEDARVHIVKRSSIYETEPRDVTAQPWFLNMALACETPYFPLQLLAISQRIERDLGRIRGASSVPRGPRTLDIDILLFQNIVMDTPRLTIPHPRMLDRRFVLEPLSEIAPHLRHPQTKDLLAKYLSRVAGQKLRRIEL